MEIPVRMRQTRTATETVESQSGLFCQAKTTRSQRQLRCCGTIDALADSLCVRGFRTPYLHGPRSRRTSQQN
jgi:hypothetical protein